MEIVKSWLGQVSATAAAHDHAAHMALISKTVSLTGIPGYKEIGYTEWSAQCEHEFADNILESVIYGEPQMVTDDGERIMFRVFETVTGTDGAVNAQGVEMLIEKEDGNRWRLTRERVLSKEETGSYQLNP